MQVHEGVCREADVVSINILEGNLVERMMQRLLTQGIEVAVVAIGEGEVKLAVGAPGGRLIVEELVSSTQLLTRRSYRDGLAWRTSESPPRPYFYPAFGAGKFECASSYSGLVCPRSGIVSPLASQSAYCGKAFTRTSISSLLTRTAPLLTFSHLLCSVPLKMLSFFGPIFFINKRALSAELSI